jgi:phospholipid/cholesterol/gamma-HCH transport system substrate-binding protein
MRTKRRQTTLVASPVLIGAVTVLVAIIAVFIAYNANSGLPFVPTYDLRAELPSGAKLIKGNEVRVGGFRVGVVEGIEPRTIERDGRRRTIAVADLKLDKKLERLPRDSELLVRPRSALGLRYIEIQPGRSRDGYGRGDTIPLRFASETLDFEDFFGTFDRDTRPAMRSATEGFGDGFAGRGQSLNQAIEAFNPLLRSLTPVMQNLSDPDTELDQFFLQLGRASAQAAPVARVQADLFTDMADTFAAIGRDPRALQDTIEKSPTTMDASVRSFRVQRPFLADFTDLSGRLRPAVRELPRSLPAVNRALAAGTPVLPRTVDLSQRLEGAFGELDDLFENPNTLMALRDLRTAISVTRPAAEFIAPYQTVCNYLVYFIHPLGEVQSMVQQGPTGGGTVLNQNVKLAPLLQQNSYGTIESSRPWDIRAGQKPQGATDELGQTLARFYAPAYQPAIDAQGNADCQNGQNGYPNGSYSLGARYRKGNLNDLNPPGPVGTGANGAITEVNLPGLSGGTFKARELGIDNLKDVP